MGAGCVGGSVSFDTVVRYRVSFISWSRSNFSIFCSGIRTWRYPGLSKRLRITVYKCQIINYDTGTLFTATTKNADPNLEKQCGSLAAGLFTTRSISSLILSCVSAVCQLFTTFVLLDPHDEEAGPGLMHGEAHTLVTHLLQVPILP